MKKMFQSVRAKLFLTLCVVILMIIAFLVIINNSVLESFYYYSKKNASLEAFAFINENIENSHFSLELEKLSLTNNFDIIIKKGDEDVYATNKDFSGDFGEIPEVKYKVSYNVFRQDDIMYADQNVTLRKIQDKKNGINFILLTGNLDNGNEIWIRMPITLIKESVEISNKFLYLIALIAVVLGGIAITWITERFTKPIEELNDIANKMAKLDFTKKYRIHDNNDEIDELGKSINTMSVKLEETIQQLTRNNMELERDIEEKSKIDEMRKQFISDVSHELKTPISLIQGYSEGLVENINSDEESRKFYAEVILDEAGKMDQLVKKLLELMKLEYGEREFHDTKFDIVEIIHEMIRNSKVMLEEQNIKVEFKEKKPIFVFADDFYMEQVLRNYFTNAMKNVKEVGGQKKIKIFMKKFPQRNTVKVSVFNSGEPISEENLARIWTRFYKVDKSRNRESGGTGIGLALVKAIMNQYGTDFGVQNKKDGVEFYFEVKLAKE